MASSRTVVKETKEMTFKEKADHVVKGVVLYLLLAPTIGMLGQVVAIKVALVLGLI